MTGAVVFGLLLDRCGFHSTQLLLNNFWNYNKKKKKREEM